MSILIKNMEMPTSCAGCKLRMAVGCCGNLPHNTRMPNCHLIELPPHGRLIDADALIEAVPPTNVDIFENCRRCELLDQEQVIDLINDAPTIIEAEETGRE